MDHPEEDHHHDGGFQVGAYQSCGPMAFCLEYPHHISSMQKGLDLQVSNMVAYYREVYEGVYPLEEFHSGLMHYHVIDPNGHVVFH